MVLCKKSPVKQLNMYYRKINKFLDQFAIESLAVESRFTLRTPRKITATNFILSFFLVVSKKHFSLRTWAAELSQIINEKVSFQAIDKKLQIRQLGFFKLLFAESIKQSFLNNNSVINSKLYSSFSRVLLEDSTCIKLAKALYHHFSGSSTGNGKPITMSRIQLSFDLKTNNLENVELTSYTSNDATFSDNIIHRINKGDLVIRDLGYWKISVFKSIQKRLGFFLSRFKLGTNIYLPDSYEIFDLVKCLKKLDKNNCRTLDMNVRIGQKDRLAVRMVALKLTTEQAKIRRRHAKSNWGRKTKTSKDSYYLMSWNILITNVDDKVWSTKDVYNAYALRWQIEMMFKNLKSNFKIDKFMNTIKGSNPIRPEILLYLCMTFLTIVYMPSFNKYRRIILEKYSKHLSSLKFGQFILDKFLMFCQVSESNIIEYLVLYYCYDKRSDRQNCSEILYSNYSLS